MKIFLSSLIFLFTSISVFAQTYDRNEVYAVFTYRFTKMTDHPSSGDYKIVVFGNSDVAKRMEKFNNSVSNGRKIIVTSTNKVEEIKEANLVFVGDTRSGKIDEIVQQVPTAIIVTERNNMFSKGSNISFASKDDKVGFEISKVNSDAKGIKLSKEILAYAQRVE